MIQAYVSKYLPKAQYEKIDQGTRYHAEIKELRGVWAVGKTKEECRKELASVAESWVSFRLKRELPVPNFEIHSRNYSGKMNGSSYASAVSGIYS